MFCDIEVKDASPVMRDHEEAAKDAEGKRWHSKEVHRGSCFTMIAEKSSPSLCRLRISRSFSHPAQYSSLRYVNAEHF